VLKKSITYEDFNGVTQTEDFHFHLSQAELVEMEATTRGGLGNYLNRIIETNDGAAIIHEFKRLIDLSIGQVSDDGKRFVKNEEIRQTFRESPAYSVLFMELATDAEKSAEFVTGIIPKGHRSAGRQDRRHRGGASAGAGRGGASREVQGHDAGGGSQPLAEGPAVEDEGRLDHPGVG
jgi:hypothetical protein